ncbi:MAG: lipocalin family protein [Nanoarchaeota archaeon]|nr:lipocalin family protein [Nanoarchaeota archaeon]
MKFKLIKFPQDELAHDNIIEWWYFNGHLKDKKGGKYTFMNCFFRADVKKVKIPFLKIVPFQTVYFSHSVLLNVKTKKFYPRVNYVSLVSKDSFSKPLLFVNYTDPIVMKGYINNIIEEPSKFKYHIKTEDFDLNLTSVKKPVLEGGTGYVKLGSKSTYYYSLTNLKTEGTIKINGKPIKVKGKSWMDHQWADESHSKDRWTWFSIQLDNKTEMVCFEYDGRKVKTYLASISHPNNRQEHTNEVKITPLGIKWVSPKTKAEYPLSWRIEVPSKNIDLKVKPLVKNQEMLFGTINYWEGPLTVEGLFNNKKVKGVGFLELVGYPMNIFNINLYRKEMEKLIIEAISRIRKKRIRFVKGKIKKKGKIKR